MRAEAIVTISETSDIRYRLLPTIRGGAEAPEVYRARIAGPRYTVAHVVAAARTSAFSNVSWHQTCHRCVGAFIKVRRQRLDHVNGPCGRGCPGTSCNAIEQCHVRGMPVRSHSSRDRHRPFSSTRPHGATRLRDHFIAIITSESLNRLTTHSSVGCVTRDLREKARGVAHPPE